MRVYHERLRVPVSWWVLGMISILMLGSGFLAGFDWRPALVVYGVLIVGLAAILIGWGLLRIEVADGELRVGRDRLPLALAGEVTVLDEEQTRALRGPRADPAAFLMTRPYLPRSVYIAVDDPAARGPYWLIGTRQPGGAGRRDRGRPARGASRRHNRGMISSQHTGAPGGRTAGRRASGRIAWQTSAGTAGAGAKALNAAAAFGAAFLARKVATMAWTKVTGKEPPSDPEDPAVGMAEAIGWAVVMGVVVGAVRVLAVRAATARTRRHATESRSS